MYTRASLRATNLKIKLAMETHKAESGTCSTCGQSDGATPGVLLYQKLVDEVSQELSANQWQRVFNTIQIGGAGGAIMVFLTFEMLRPVTGEGFSYYWGRVLGEMFQAWITFGGR